ncbi:MAG: methyltransferase domain-containing protein [Blastocatellia bacterium]|nr:methyltransferase domain-containing protein [Blastocatellia bacterium]
MANDTWNSSLYDQKHSFVYKYGEDVLGLLEPKPGERILDVGCGTGHLTAQIAEAGATVVGLDSSAAMIDTAQAAYPHLKFVQADASDFSFDEPFDAVFSNAALHWVLQAEAAVKCMSHALRSGGRLVIECGGKGNIRNILTALNQAMIELEQGEMERIWVFHSISEYATLLEKYGLEVNQAFLFDRPTKLEGEDGMLNWLRMFGTVRTQKLSDEMREKAFALANEQLRDVQYIDGHWYADYRRLRISARKL